ncbi:MAG: hypothetical protein U0M61_03585 [Succinivibrio sp.]|nr:hypothetical protein [Succinivibrio sp.]
MFILVVLIILGSLIYKIIRAINEGDTSSSYQSSLFDNNHSHSSLHNSMFNHDDYLTNPYDLRNPNNVINGIMSDDYLNDPCDLRNPNNVINGTMSPDYFDHNDTFSSSNSFGSSSSFNDPFNDPFSSSSSFGSSSSFNNPFNNGL